MKSMNLQVRKMNLIEFLLGVQDEKVFTKIESTIHKSIKNLKPTNIVFSKQDLIERSEFSNIQIKNGHILTQKELELQSKNW